jgi:type II secretory pathway pseudopilin PulG
MITGRINPIVKRFKLSRNRRAEGGYALVAMMGVVMFALILTTAAAPSVKFETQREREEEMLWRGQQVAGALARYAAMRGGQYPTDLKQLVEGIETGTKRIRLLRPSALCDPMLPCTPGETNWRLVRPGDPLVRELLDAYIATQQRGSIQLPPPPGNLVAFAQMGMARLPGQAADTQLDGNIGAQNNNESDSDSSRLGPSERGPIIGVVSKKSDKMFRSYYGIEYYDHTLFFPGVPVFAGGILNPMIFAGAPTNNADPSCPRGGVLIDGKCWGGLIPGRQCRGPNGETVPCPQQ